MLTKLRLSGAVDLGFNGVRLYTMEVPLKAVFTGYTKTA